MNWQNKVEMFIFYQSIYLLNDSKGSQIKEKFSENKSKTYQPNGKTISRICSEIFFITLTNVSKNY